MCLTSYIPSIYGYTETVKETQTCQKLNIDGVDSILCVCSGDNCNSDDSYLTAFNSGTFSLGSSFIILRLYFDKKNIIF